MPDLTMTAEELQEKIDAAIAAETAGLKSKRDELLTAQTSLKAQLDQIEQDKKDAIKKAADDQLAAEGKWEELVDKMKKDHKDELKTLQDNNTALSAKNTKLDGTVRRNLVDNELLLQLTTAGVTDPILMKAATALLAPGVEIEDVEDELVARMNGKSIEESIKVWAEADGKSFISNKNSGGGSGGSGGGGGTDEWDQYFDPSKDTHNATRQQDLKKENPDQYDALKKKYARPDLPFQASR